MTSTPPGHDQLADPRLQDMFVGAGRLSVGEKVSAAYVLFLAVVLELALKSASLPTVGRWFGVQVHGSDEQLRPEQSRQKLPLKQKRQIRYVRRLMRNWPVGAGTCLRESILVGHFLRDRNPALRVGVGKEGERIVAHAWLEVDGSTVGGHDGFVPFERNSH